MTTVKCALCNGYVNKSIAVVYKEKNYHPVCCHAVIERDELYSYICQLFGFKAPGPTVLSQINNFFTKYKNWTYKGIYNALVYFYEVKKGSKERANNAIGIVPYVYDEAQEYFVNLAAKQSHIQRTLNEQEGQTAQVITVTQPKPKPKRVIDIENL